ncbi:iron transporter permease [Arthrobacter sp. RIT-PI-e]|uniref:ABC transporter permease n=1 Tax=Arthrobacter sp. RIT-PI-e TaxID=1681197 RepID=UPI0006765262|nr:iron ABC transporter permease [Arthrobacter sp. RIT-PI-e]KNC18566.1 iron transporter permease [Arthrobacter sp. RIT-PI-e]
MSLDTPPAAALPAAAPPRKGSRQGGARMDAVTKLVITAVVLILAILIGYPLVRILTQAFGAEGLETLRNIATSPANRAVLLNTVVLGVLVGAVGTAIGFAFAYAQARLDFRGKKLLHLIALLPIVSPPFAVATAVITLFGRSGLVTNKMLGLDYNIYGLTGLTLVLSLSFFPVAYMNLLGMLRSLDPATDEAASSLGADRWKIFRSVTVPMLVPGFASCFLLLFVEAIADLANPLVIGGDFTVLSSRAYIAITGEYDVASGAAYSLVLLLPGLLVFLVQRYWAERRSVVSVTGKPSGNVTLLRSPLARIPLLTVVLAIATLIVAIYVTVFVGAFTAILGVNNTFTLANYRYVLSGIGSDAMFTTTILALIATPVAGVLGMILAWLVVRKVRRGRGALDFLGMLGLAVPGTVLGIGYALAFNKPFIIGNIQLLPALAGGGAIFGGALAIVMVYVIRSMPSGQRSGIAALQQIDPAIDEASTSLGASGLRTFRSITLPLIRPALLSGLTYAFARAMTTLSPIIFITTPQTKIMTSQILSEVDSGRFGNAFAYCTILIAIVLGVIGLMNLLIRDRRAPTRVN